MDLCGTHGAGRPFGRAAATACSQTGAGWPRPGAVGGNGAHDDGIAAAAAGVGFSSGGCGRTGGGAEAGSVSVLPPSGGLRGAGGFNRKNTDGTAALCVPEQGRRRRNQPLSAAAAADAGHPRQGGGLPHGVGAAIRLPVRCHAGAIRPSAPGAAKRGALSCLGIRPLL